MSPGSGGSTGSGGAGGSATDAGSGGATGTDAGPADTSLPLRVSSRRLAGDELDERAIVRLVVDDDLRPVDAAVVAVLARDLDRRLVRFEAAVAEEGRGEVRDLAQLRGELLLHLLDQEELSVEGIQVARICDRYLGFLESLERIDIDAAGEFLLMASTLMRMKSRSLLPAEEQVLEEEDLDPRFELVRQLIEYRKFRRAAESLGMSRAALYRRLEKYGIAME